LALLESPSRCARVILPRHGWGHRFFLGAHIYIWGRVKKLTGVFCCVYSSMATNKTPEHILKRQREYYKLHRRKRIRYAKERYYNKREEILRKVKERRERDPEFAEQQRVYAREYYKRKKNERKQQSN